MPRVLLALHCVIARFPRVNCKHRVCVCVCVFVMVTILHMSSSLSSVYRAGKTAVDGVSTWAFPHSRYTQACDGGLLVSRKLVVSPCGALLVFHEGGLVCVELSAFDFTIDCYTWTSDGTDVGTLISSGQFFNQDVI